MTDTAVDLEFEPEPVLGEPITMNVLLYGPAKEGKTAGACSAPGPILLLTADTRNATRYAQLKYPGKIKVVRVDSLQKLAKAANWLETKEGKKTRTVVLDTVSEIHRVLLESQSNRAVRPSLPIRGDVSVYLERFCRSLCEDASFTTVIVAHQFGHETEGSADERSTEKLPFTGVSNDKLSQKLLGMVDIIGYVRRLELVDQEGAEPRTVYAAALRSGGGRHGGDRFDVLGPHRDLNLTEWHDLASTAAPDSIETTTTEAAAAA